MENGATGMFINETHTDAAVWQFRVEKMLLEGKTEYQTYQICEIPRFGKSLFLDYNIQTSLMDEYIFHECMTQPAMTLHPNPKKVCVCGGGEGATLWQALQHNTVVESHMVDIDKELVDMARVHLPEWHRGCFDDPKNTMHYTDARQWLVDHKGYGFDAILSDLPNPHEEGPGQMLFTREYFQICADAMSEDGVLALQAGSANENYPDCMVSCIKTLESMDCFAHVAGYYGIVTTFFQPWGFVLASKKYNPLDLSVEEIAQRFEKRGVQNRYYTPEFHSAVFNLPPYLHRAKDEVGRILTDKEPFVWTA